MTEVLLNEPVICEEDATCSTTQQVLEVNGFDPLLMGDLDLPNCLYVEDIRKKFTVALREVRKYILIHRYHTAKPISDLVNSESRFDRDSLPIESKVSYIINDIFRPLVQEVDNIVLPNLRTGMKNIHSPTPSSEASGLSRMTLEQRGHYTPSWGKSSGIPMIPPPSYLDPPYTSSMSAYGATLPSPHSASMASSGLIT
jgi:hypothetical protein